VAVPPERQDLTANFACSGFMDFCASDPNMMICPEGLWYMKVSKQDILQTVELTEIRRSK
jgi:(2Fe-2S) ferredoxin